MTMHLEDQLKTDNLRKERKKLTLRLQGCYNMFQVLKTHATFTDVVNLSVVFSESYQHPKDKVSVHFSS